MFPASDKSREEGIGCPAAEDNRWFLGSESGMSLQEGFMLRPPCLLVSIQEVLGYLR